MDANVLNIEKIRRSWVVGAVMMVFELLCLKLPN